MLSIKRQHVIGDYMKKNIKKLICLGLVAIFLLSMNSTIYADSAIGKEDFDPLLEFCVLKYNV